MCRLAQIPGYKLLVVGDTGVAKTTLLQRHVTGEFEKNYIATLDVEVHPLQFDTNVDPVRFNCWDFAGQGSNDDHYADAQCAIILFDVTSRLSYRNVPNWYHDIRRVCEHIPIVLCGNKVDVERHKVKPKHITFQREKNLTYVEMSVKANYNIETPLLWLARKLVGDDNVKFMDPPACCCHMSDLVVDARFLAAVEADIAAAMNEVLPDDDDDI
ncbi:GTP-binding nuclear protein Ran, partial [Saprolegnia diclina VS20]